MEGKDGGGEQAGSGHGEEAAVAARGDLKPWEQHSAVISIPRFDYKAPNSLLERPHSGFLITCPIKREKSATKEAISILEKYVQPASSNNDESVKSYGSQDSKKRKVCPNKTDEESLSKSEQKMVGNISEGCVNADAKSSKSFEGVARSVSLSLVKLNKSGLLLFTFLGEDYFYAINVLADILRSLECHNLKPPQWCHRIFPIQRTCILKGKDLYEAVLKLIQEYLDSDQRKLEKPIKFAVGYNRRGMDETVKRKPKTAAHNISEMDMLDRGECFKVVAKAVKDIAADAVVDLKSPELTVLIELLPIAGVPNDSLVAGVSVLSHNLVSMKPRLCVKTLVPDVQSTKQKGQSAALS